MNAKQKIHQAKMAKWVALIKEQSESGLTIKQWCEQSGYTLHAYNYWKHILKEAALNNVSLPEIVPLAPPSIVSPAITSPSILTESRLPNSRDLRESCNAMTASAVSISLGDIHIEIGSNASDDVISGIIKAVRHA